ncbi:MAG TPA: helix-turn-helix transcriptional regulator [Microthrixaceae bacterium]|nr:helix-turn-helix transcriptional regulator [Microthrixaceae bacterium]
MARHSLSKVTTETLRILGDSIRVARLSRGWSIEQLAERIGVSHPTVVKVERGDPGVGVGTVFEAATLLGIVLYGDEESRSRYGAHQRSELALLPSAGRRRRVVDDDF